MKHILFSRQHLFTRITFGFIIGIFIGLFFPNFSLSTKFVGDTYLNLIRMMIVPIIFASVATGIINMNNSKELSRVSMKTLTVFLCNLILSSVLSIGIARLIQPGSNIQLDAAPTFEGELASTSIVDFFNMIVPKNIIQAMADGNILSVILFTALFGTAIVQLGDSTQMRVVKDFINGMSRVFFQILNVVMAFSPFGVASLMAFTIAQYGSGIFSALGKYVLTIYIACFLVFILVLMIPTVLYTRLSPIRLLKEIYPLALMTMSTTSSAACLPTSMQISEERLNVPSDITRFVLPLGSTIHMVGGSVSFSCLAIFVADFYQIHLSWEHLIFCTIVSTLINMGAPGIPGGGIILGATFLSIVGLPFDLMGPIAALYRLLDMAFTTMNSAGDFTTNLIIAKAEGVWDGATFMEQDAHV